jgi:hypothetical protein
MKRLTASFVAVACLCVCNVAESTQIVVTINTTGLAGTAAQLALDFVDGGSPPSNIVYVSGFSTNGSIGTSTSTGDVTGDLGATAFFGDTSLFNELLTALTLNSTLSFTFDASANPPSSGGIPDSFSVFLLDAVTGLPLFATTDPTGSDALLQFDLTNPGQLTLFDAPGGEATITLGSAPTAVPEPTTALLLVTGAAASIFRRRRRP